jgi:hypothetical protein
MNNLNNTHCCVTTSKEERNGLLEKLHNNGVTVSSIVWRERNDPNDYINWPVIIVDEDGVNGGVEVTVDDNPGNRQQLTVSEFLGKAGVFMTPQGGSTIKHHFLIS